MKAVHHDDAEVATRDLGVRLFGAQHAALQGTTGEGCASDTGTGKRR
jgi:hypothetical protein